MKHLALRARSVHGDRAFTASGLGDRIHGAWMAWAYGQGEPVTLHLTRDHMTGGQFGNKPESWGEIANLFPAGMVTICPHDVSPKSEREWANYTGIEPYRFNDHPGPQEPEGFDIVPYLRDFPRLTATGAKVRLPERFVTTQWDANGAGRRVAGRERVLAEYPSAVTVGGEAEGDLRWSLAAIGHAMTRAEGHVGVDSGFFHLAVLYMPWKQLHLCHGQSVSHHLRRARDFGARCERM